MYVRSLQKQSVRLFTLLCVKHSVTTAGVPPTILDIGTSMFHFWRDGSRSLHGGMLSLTSQEPLGVTARTSSFGGQLIPGM